MASANESKTPALGDLVADLAQAPARARTKPGEQHLKEIVLHLPTNGKVYSFLKEKGFSEGEGYHGAWTVAAMAAAGYVQVSKAGNVVRAKTKPVPAVLSALTSGAVAPTRPTGYHRQKGWFSADGELTPVGLATIGARYTKESVKFGFSVPQAVAILRGMTKGGPVEIPTKAGDKTKTLSFKETVFVSA
jgi:hypothetical protein